MGDSTAMTIEFLRARLLSERSVSRTARQRADQLAKRVVELEEQLRIVSIQRKKAEKAAAEILAILETQGIGELSEAVGSSSDGEVPYDDTRREYESSIASRLESSEVEDGLSGTEPEVSPSQGRSLSWKSHSNGPDSHDKQRTKQMRQRQRQRSFTTTLQSSSKHQVGKSCRKIKPKDSGSTVEGETQANVLDAQGDGGPPCSNYRGNQSKLSVEASIGMMDGAVADISDSPHLDVDCNRQMETHLCGTDDMERVLEKQAMLIDQFQAEENAQREWEQKYNEKTTSTLADYEPGNLIPAASSSISKMELSELADKAADHDGKAISGAVHVSSTEAATVESLFSSDKNDRSEQASVVGSSNGSMPRDATASSSEMHSNAQENDLARRKFDGTTAEGTKSISQKFTASTPERYDMIRNPKENQVMQHDAPNGYPRNSKSHPSGNRAPGDSSSQTMFFADDQGNLPKLGHQQKNQVQPQGYPSRALGSSLGGVLEALQRAKLSLTQELSKMPSPSRGTLALAAPTNSRMRAMDGLDISIGPASLFRLPTDSIPPSQPSGPKFYASGLSFPTDRPDVGYPTSSYGYPSQAGSRVVLGREYTDNYFGPGMDARDSRRYFRASSDLLANRALPFGREVAKSYSDARNGMPSEDRRYALHGSDQTRADPRVL